MSCSESNAYYFVMLSAVDFHGMIVEVEPFCQ